MPMIQLRNVPEALHRTLKVRAAQSGLSLSDYLLQQAREIADRPTPEEMWERLRRLEPNPDVEDAAEAIRAERDAR